MERTYSRDSGRDDGGGWLTTVGKEYHPQIRVRVPPNPNLCPEYVVTSVLRDIESRKFPTVIEVLIGVRVSLYSDLSFNFGGTNGFSLLHLLPSLEKLTKHLFPRV